MTGYPFITFIDADGNVVARTSRRAPRRAAAGPGRRDGRRRRALIRVRRRRSLRDTDAAGLVSQRQAAGTSMWSVTEQSAPNTTKRSKPRRNQRSWVTAMTVPVNWASPASSASAETRSRLSVGSSSSSRRGAGPLEQEDLEAGLLTARQRVERLLGAPLQLVAAQHRPSPGRARRRGRGGCRAACRPVHSGCSWVWWNRPGTTPAPSRHVRRVPDGRVAGQQAQEVALADAVAAEHGDALAEPQLEVERVGQPVELERPRGSRPACRCGRRRGACRCAARAPPTAARASRRTAAAGSRPPSAWGRTPRRSGPAGSSRRRGPPAACAPRRTTSGRG